MSQQDTPDMSKYFYRASAADFMKIPGSPIAYWASNRVLTIFSEFEPLSKFAMPRQGLATSDNDRFLKLWFEVGFDKIGFSMTCHEDARLSKKRWFPCQKGGSFRKWYGNNTFVVNWESDGKEILEYAKKLYGSPTRTIKNMQHYFREGMTWSTISSSALSMRYSPVGFISETKGAMCFAENRSDLSMFLGFCNSKLVNRFLMAISPTLDFHEGPVGRLPTTKALPKSLVGLVDELVGIGRADWDQYEISWDFNRSPIIGAESKQTLISDSYRIVSLSWGDAISRTHALEVQINRIFIDVYGLQNELSDDIPLKEITLTCNPYYRYGNDKSDAEHKSMLQCDTTEELVSYAIGCMMGRYSLDRPGLVLASQGETLQDYLSQIPSPRFAPDNDGILPLTDQEWFADDATNRFREFVRVVWGDEHLQENLDFVAESLCLHAIKPKRGESALDSIRRYLSTQFYKDHLKTYKKRPIYWLFSSGKHNAFECLVYLHRYNEGTLARMRTEYVIPLTAKLSSYAHKLDQDIDASTSTAEKKRLEKELSTLHNQQAELAAFDEKLRHYADQRIRLDLDDGVKVNYGKFGDLLAEVKAITGDKDDQEG